MHKGALARGVLTLYLANASAPFPFQAQTWQLVDHTNGSGTETTHLLSTTSTNTYTSTNSPPKQALLQIKCFAPLTDSVTISIDSDATFAVKTDATATLPIRLDDEPPIHAAWANLSLHQILIYDLRNLLPSHQRIAISLPLGTRSPQPLTFDLSQLASAMRDFNCRRRLQ